MINRDLYNENIKDILLKEKVENIPLKNISILKKYFSDEELSKLFYEKFDFYYRNIYGNDTSDLFMKLQDFVYKLNLFIDVLINKFEVEEEYLYDFVYSFVKNSTIDFFEANDYNISDRVELENTLKEFTIDRDI